MKKSKLTLGLVTALCSVGALTACNEVTYSDGVVLEYTDAQGNSTPIRAVDLFGEQYSTGVASTDFDRVYEVLIRKYYESGTGKTLLNDLKAEAEKSVQDIKDQAKKNADNNNTRYDEEFSKLLTSAGVENVNELYEAKLYEAEKQKFEDDYQTDSKIEEIRDFGYQSTADNQGNKPYGRGSDGYLIEQMPYTISHILVKLSSATNGEHAQATISESESRKLGQVIELLAGADVNGNGKDKANTRTEFGEIARQNSEDTGSAEKYGQLDVMDRDTADSFINEFKFGIYAYEAIYNQANQSVATNPYAATVETHENSGETFKLTDKIKFSDDATYTDMSLAQSADEIAHELDPGEHYIKNFFAGTANQIATIPYGAAVALAKDEVAKNAFTIDGTDTQMNWEVNNNSSTFFPRNILFNKYFNNHRVAVIVPNEIPYNDNSIAQPEGRDGDYLTENFKGVFDDAYAALPGFSRDTKDVLPATILGQDSNVLTTEKGQIVLAVRGGSSGSYEGIHFMVIDRSALVEYAKPLGANDKAGAEIMKEADYNAARENSNVNSLSEFYTIYQPKDAEFPSYTPTGSSVEEKKTTYVNQLHTTSSNYNDNRKKIRDKITGYNSNKNTYMFQYLLDDGAITFAANDIAKNAEVLIRSWIKSKREKSAIDSAESFDNTWATYIEYLTAANEARELKADGSQRLISETCAIGYNKRNSDRNNAEYANSIWSNGGACYAK